MGFLFYLLKILPDKVRIGILLLYGKILIRKKLGRYIKLESTIADYSDRGCLA
jgi:hypothetical protein